MPNHRQQIQKVLEDITGIKNPQVEFSANEQFGDYSSNIFLRDKTLNIDEIIKKVNDLNLDFTAEKLGKFINFRIKNEVLVNNLIQIDRQKENYGKDNIGKGKTVVIDYSSPNIAKPFGIGHLRSTVIGQAIYNHFKFLDYRVIGDNHLGDWGTQFGALLTQISKIPNYKLQMPNWTVDDLVSIYVDFHQKVKDNPELMVEARSWFKKLEDNDSEARVIWKQCINISLNEFNKIYDMLGVKIDNAYGESFYEEEMGKMMNDSKVNKYLEIGESGSKIINLEKVGIKTPLMFLKSDGATTYATRDLATLKFRQAKYSPDIIIYEVGGEQKLYFQQIFAAAKLLKIIGQDCELIHTAHGLYLAPDGKKFSTRKGKTIKLEEVLEEAIERAKKLGNKNKETAKQVGIGAIKYFDLMHSVQSNVVFDWEKVMNMEGNSGPYIQYTIARINSIISKSANLQINKSTNLELNLEETSVLRKLSQFHEVIVTAAKNYSPNVLCNYLYELASKFNTFYNSSKIIGGENERFRLQLTKSTGQVLKNGLNLLGIEAPEKM